MPRSNWEIRYNPSSDRYEIINLISDTVCARHTTRSSAEAVLARVFPDDNNEDNMNPDERTLKIEAIELGGFKTRAVRTSNGYVGQVFAGTVARDADRSSGDVFWDSEPFETRNDAMSAANDKLSEKLKSLFA